MMAENPGKAQLLSEIRSEWLLLERLISGLSEEQKSAPGAQGDWSVKDTLAHLSAWEKVLLDRLGAVMSGGPMQYPPIRSEEELNLLNDKIYAENKERLLSSVLMEFRSVYHGVLTVLEALDKSMLAQPALPGLGEEGPRVWQLIQDNTSGHFQEHRQALEEWFASG